MGTANIETIEKTALDTLQESMKEYDLSIDKACTAIDEAKKLLFEKISLIKKLEVTDASVAVVKEDLRDVKKAIDAIDGFRIKFKKETLSHMTPIEALCKDIKATADEELETIKGELDAFVQARKDEKIKKAKTWIDEIGEELGASEMVAQIEVKSSWGNTNATQKAVKEDITQQYMALIAAEKAKQEQLELYQDMIDIENQSLNTKMILEDFDRLIKAGADNKTILGEIKLRADVIREAENPKPAVVEPPTPQEAPQPVVPAEPTWESIDDFDESGLHTAEETETSDSFLMEVFDSPDRANEVITLLLNNGFMARVAK